MAGARRYSELIVWQLADALRIETFKITSKPAFTRNLKAKNQADDAADSVCRNIAEGFGCETHREFARFLEFSRRSLQELHDALRSAELRKYVTTPECVPARALIRRLFPALNRFIAYLYRTPDHRHRQHADTGTRSRERADLRSRDRTDKRSQDRTDPRSPDRTDVRSRDRTDKRKEDRTDKR
jgi:four helix bundle protein